ncbi:DUF934 domain-containing protein [Marinobacter zhejiangensis]|uniref:Uncharacterized conserved protein, DUF934 family n=1 Tax=Marinobacter zhejiangensis TaxID=488535 RepID=A0A1I4PG29_9GAMM|nr:DUF934 domain-containing protein [Marinobacter zhejiangensis]SFM26762.1 Uncharacterized conserved protein, DUF934 family [Marinobacter zhejiangensis]
MNNVIGLVDGVAECLADDPWRLDDGEKGSSTGESVIVTLERWKAALCGGEAGGASNHGVVLGPDDDPAELRAAIGRIPIIALQFPSFRDGRAYSQANLLRTRYGFKGDLRAIGDVLRDQLVLMRHCGFTSFAVRSDKCVVDALKGFDGCDMVYARSVATPEPLYRRRVRGGQSQEAGGHE